LLGGTAGRTTLNGEGLQHQDGHSHILATTFPSLKSYDPAFAYELAVIVREGIKRMYKQGEKIFYYITLYNENYEMPALPNDTDDRTKKGIVQGGYLWKRSALKSKPEKTVHLLASGSIMQQAISAADQLEEQGVATHIWSITSFTELNREAESCERYNRLNPSKPARIPLVEQMFAEESGICIAVTDYMKALPASIANWMLLPYTCLGTDGVGVSEARGDLRDYFEVSDRYIVAAALASLDFQDGTNKEQLGKQFDRLNIRAGKLDPVLR